MNKILKILLFLVVPFHTSYATTWGDLDKVSIEPLITVTGTNNEMRGFGWFRNGFLFEDASTSCTFSGVFPISGLVDMNGGSLYLAQDLIFGNVTHLLGLGIIYGSNHLIDLCSTITCIPSDTHEFSDASIKLSDDITLSSAITFKGNCSIDGCHSNLYLRNGAIIVDSNSTLELKRMTLVGISGTNIRCADDTAKLILNNVTWVQNGDTTFGNGGITFVNNVDFVGSSTFSYESACTSTIESNSQWTIAEHLCLSIDRSAVTRMACVDVGSNYIEPLSFKDLTSALKFSDSTWHIRSPGMRITKGTIEVCRDVVIDVASTSTSDGLIFGDGTAQGTLCFEIFSGCSVYFPRGHVVYDVVSENWIVSRSTTSRFIRDANNVFYIKQNLNLPHLTLTYDPRSSFIVDDGKTVRWDNIVFSQATGEYQTQATRYDQFTFLLSSNDYIFLHRGNFVGVILIAGAGSRIQGNGTIAGPISFSHPGAELILDFNGTLAYDVHINGGKIVLAQDCTLVDGVNVQGSGTIDLATSSLIFGNTDERDISGSIVWQGLGGSVVLHSPVNLSGQWLFGGNCVLDGTENTLDLSAGGEIVVASHSTLRLKNIRVKGLAQNNVRCIDNTAKIVLDDVAWQLDDNFSFTTGKFIAIDQNVFTGPYTFAYQSAQASTISSYSSLHILDGMCFEIGLSSTPGASQPLAFTDKSSKLVLNDSMLKIPSTGLHLTKGLIDIEGDVVVDINSTSTSTGLVLGDGTQVNDAYIELSAGSSIDIRNGHLVYNVISCQGIKAKSRFSKLRRSANNLFYLKQNLLLSNITVELETPADFLAEPLKWIRYSNVVFWYDDGEHESEYLVDSYAYGATELLLNGNQSIWLDKRSLPVATYISGTGNKIFGDGNVLQPITWLNSNAELTLGIGGIVQGGIVLNGGTLRLEAPMRVGSKFGPGTVDLSSYSIEFCPQPIVWDSSICWSGNHASLILNSDLCLSSKWAFDGACTIYGNGNTLTFDGGAIYLTNGSHLTFKGIILKNIVDLSITSSWPADLLLSCSGFTYTCTCLGGDALITLDDVTWLQDADVNVAEGAFEFKNSVKMKGNAILSYRTMRTSTIDSGSSLKLSKGFIFDYCPINGSKELLRFVDESSILVLNGATIRSAATGLALKKGKMIIDDHSYLSSGVFQNYDIYKTPIATDEGISLGDGIAEHDFACEIDSGVTLEVQQGSLKYCNVDLSLWQMLSPYSKLRINDNAALYLYENLYLGLGTAEFGTNTILYRVPGKRIIGSVSVVGDLRFGSIVS